MRTLERIHQSGSAEVLKIVKLGICGSEKAYHPVAALSPYYFGPEMCPVPVSEVGGSRNEVLYAIDGSSLARRAT
jgi:hypothetical protein